MKKFLVSFSLIVISLFLLSLFGWMASHLTKGDKDFGFLNGPVKAMYEFPNMFARSVEEVKSLPKTFRKTPPYFKPVNKLTEDLWVLSAYSDTSNSRSVVLMNLKNDSVKHKWTIKNPYQEHDRVMHPIMLKDTSLIYSIANITGLIKLDKNSNVLWKQFGLFHHHSINLDVDGNLWVCSHEPVFYATGMYRLDGKTVFYTDNYISKVDPLTGKILYHKSVSQIFKDNNLANYLLKSHNLTDPIHINDVEPVPKTTAFYEKGDVFISARNLSLILHYRPSTGKVVRLIEGPFAVQHDVDFLNDSTLFFFNNNSWGYGAYKTLPPPPDSSRLTQLGDFASNIVRYDLWNDSISFYLADEFRKNHIYTHTEGIIEICGPDKILIEEQNPGIVWIIENGEVVYKNIFASQHDGYHHLTNWLRIVK